MVVVGRFKLRRCGPDAVGMSVDVVGVAEGVVEDEVEEVV